MKADKYRILDLLLDNSRMGEFDDMFDYGTVRTERTVSTVRAFILFVLDDVLLYCILLLLLV